MKSQLHIVIQYLHQHPHIGGIAAFLIAFSESLALIGSLIPGSVTMTAIGALIGASILPTISTIIWAISGAFCGDLLSYLIGVRFDQRLLKFWPFRRYPQWIKRGENFFRKHGGKSVFIGRFVGPMRSAVPLIAGLLKMPAKRFAIAALFAAATWAILYMIPGIIVGALSLELPPKLASEFILFVIVLIAIIWGITWAITLFIYKLGDQIDAIIKYSWDYLYRKRSSHWLTRLLSDPQKPNNHRQLSLAVFATLIGTTFLLVFFNVFHHGITTGLNEPAYHLLRSTRTARLDKLLMIFTIIGNKLNLFILFGLMSFVFLIKRLWRLLAHWIGITLFSASSVVLIKHFFYFARPGGLLNGPVNSSFPSGHVTFSVALLGFLATLIANEWLKKYKKIIYYPTGLLILLIALSRIYFGAHWLSDIIGGFLLGSFWVVLFTLLYRRTQRLATNKIITFTVPIALIIASSIYGSIAYHKTLHNYQYTWPTPIITQLQWWQHESPNVAIYSHSRFGKPQQPLNLQWLGNLIDIRNDLTQQGWEAILLESSWQRLLGINPHQLPILPKLYLNKPPALILIKPTNGSNPPLMIELWHSNITIRNINAPLWLGTIQVFIPSHKLLTLHHRHSRIQKRYNGILSRVIPYLKGWRYKTVRLSKKEQTHTLRQLNWDGKVLLIRAH